MIMTDRLPTTTPTRVRVLSFFIQILPGKEAESTKKRENIRNKKAELSTLSKDQLSKAILASPRCRPLLFLCNKQKLFEIIGRNPSDSNHPQFNSDPLSKDPELLNPSRKKNGIYLARTTQQEPSSEKYSLTMNKLSINLPEFRQSCPGNRKIINLPELKSKLQEKTEYTSQQELRWKLPEKKEYTSLPESRWKLQLKKEYHNQQELKLNPRESRGFINQLKFKWRLQENKRFLFRQELNRNSQDNKRNTSPSEDSLRQKSMNQKLKNNLQDNKKYTSQECRLKDPFNPNPGLSPNPYYNNSPFSNPQELSNK